MALSRGHNHEIKIGDYCSPAEHCFESIYQQVPENTVTCFCLRGSSRMSISCVVPTLNRSALLRNALCSLINQNVSQNLYEILVIDNGSTDDTKKVSHQITKTPDRNIRYILESEPDFSQAGIGGDWRPKGNCWYLLTMISRLHQVGFRQFSRHSKAPSYR